jgi:hypothetical protein
MVSRSKEVEREGERLVRGDGLPRVDLLIFVHLMLQVPPTAATLATVSSHRRGRSAAFRTDGSYS